MAALAPVSAWASANAGWIAAASAAVSAASAIGQSRTQAAQAEAQQNADERNAQIANQQAVTIGQQAAAQEDLQRKKARAILAQQRAGVAQSGTGESGSNAAVLQQSELDAEMDALNIRYEGQLQQKAALDQAGVFRMQAQQSGYNRSTALANGYTSAAASALGSASNYLGVRYGRR